MEEEMMNLLKIRFSVIEAPGRIEAELLRLEEAEEAVRVAESRLETALKYDDASDDEAAKIVAERELYDLVEKCRAAQVEFGLLSTQFRGLSGQEVFARLHLTHRYVLGYYITDDQVKLLGELLKKGGFPGAESLSFVG